MTYGDLEIHALPEGVFTVGLDKRFVPWAEGDPKRPGTLFISVTPFLVRAPEETILIDTGLGSWAEGRGTEFLLDGLGRHGVAPEAVDRVVLSHLHFDHAGGAISPVGPAWRPTFPNADYVVQGPEVEAAGYHGESARARDLVVETLEAEGQLVAVEGDAAGFVSNRVLMPMINEAVFCVHEGVATPEAVDTVMKLGMAHPMGPLTLADFIGLDVCLSIMEVLHRELGEDKYRPCPLLRKMVAAGHLGRKSGQGFYDYA